MLNICSKFCKIIWNDIKVIEWTWFLYWKLQRGIILQKDTISILAIYKLMKWHKTEKKCRRSNSSQSKYGHTFIWTKFREIISNAIKVIERTQYLCWIFKRGIIQQIMLVEWPFLISATWLSCFTLYQVSWNNRKRFQSYRADAISILKLQRGIIPQKM